MRYLAALALAAIVVPAGSLTAQKSDDEWLEHCQRDRWDDRYARARHCEIRETGMKATGRLTVEPGMNSGVEIIGWDSDSIAVTARIQVTARTDEDAAAIARDIKIEASGATIRATGGRSLGRREHWSVTNGPMTVRRR